MIITTSALDELNEEFEHRDPGSILAWAAETFADNLVIVTSFQPTGIVTLNMLHELGLDVEVITLDTGLLFPETYELIDTVERRFDLRLRRIRPKITVDEQAILHGDRLWERDPNLCCDLRKVAPLGETLVDYDAWLTGLRRDQPGRSRTAILSTEGRYGKVKICPFANWTDDMIWTYVQQHELPYNALHDRGYPSIGCNTAVCTRPVEHNAGQRDGRWVSHSKTECGIHAFERHLG